LLKEASISEVEEAFRDWHFREWGDDYPKMPTPGQIMESINAVREARRTEGSCSKECRAKHGTGYGTKDIMWLVTRRMLEAKPGVRWSIGDWEELLKELDGKRPQGTPEWRKNSNGQQFLRI
jgi:hypothetical protein